MPRFYFDIIDGSQTNDRDDVGQELPDQETAWHVTTRYAGEKLRDLDGSLRPDADLGLNARAENGASIFQITIREEELNTEVGHSVSGQAKCLAAFISVRLILDTRGLELWPVKPVSL
jgi:hypothetical protein